jgi:hypothetical protein
MSKFLSFFERQFIPEEPQLLQLFFAKTYPKLSIAIFSDELPVLFLSTKTVSMSISNQRML